MVDFFKVCVGMGQGFSTRIPGVGGARLVTSYDLTIMLVPIMAK